MWGSNSVKLVIFLNSKIFLDKIVSKLVYWYICNLFDVIASGKTFSLNMKALPVTISWLWSSVYSQIVCKVCPQIFSECIQDTEIIFRMYFAYEWLLMPIEFVVNCLMLN